MEIKRVHFPQHLNEIFPSFRVEKSILEWAQRNVGFEQCLVLVGFNGTKEPMGYLIAGMGTDFDQTPICHIFDVFSKGAAETHKEIWEKFEAWAKSQGAKAITAKTFRPKGFIRKYGFFEDGTLIRKELI